MDKEQLETKNFLTLLRYRIPHDEFGKIPKQERVFFLKALTVLSEIQILQKAIVFSTNAIPGEAIGSVKVNAQSLQALFLSRLLAGILSEAHKLIRLGFDAKPLPRAKDESKLIKKLKFQSLRNVYPKDEIGEKAWAGLKQIDGYFHANNKDNVIKLIRNKFAFHYDLDVTHKWIDELLKDLDEPELFFAEHDGNCHYEVANEVSILTLVRKMGYDSTPENLKIAIDKVLNNISKTARWFADFFNGFVLAFSQKHFDINMSKLQELKIENVPLLSSVRLPYFVIRDFNKYE